ncbi:hypothetical protein [Hydrogenophaga sp. OTU3427]|uniref:hypothetical protein n=1 Tax=Hydrogenophaga sp. OTU3427 TaxID=3043856 RepID=UPI00313CC0CA
MHVWQAAVFTLSCAGFCGLSCILARCLIGDGALAAALLGWIAKASSGPRHADAEGAQAAGYTSRLPIST